MSVYLGFQAGDKLLQVSLFNLLVHNNLFADCYVNSGFDGIGNVYGGAISVYFGGYSSIFPGEGPSIAESTIGDTVVRNISVTLDKVQFKSCSVRRDANVHGANSYGGAFSFYVGAYVSILNAYNDDSNSKIGATTTSGVSVTVNNVSFSNCSAVTIASRPKSGVLGPGFGAASSYGGSMSVYFGAYAWSYSNFVNSIARCDSTRIVDLAVCISHSVFSDTVSLSRKFCLPCFFAQ